MMMVKTTEYEKSTTDEIARRRAKRAPRLSQEARESITAWVVAEGVRLWAEGVSYSDALREWATNSPGSAVPKPTLGQFCGIVKAAQASRPANSPPKWTGKGMRLLNRPVRGYYSKQWAVINALVSVALKDYKYIDDNLWLFVRALIIRHPRLSMTAIVGSLEWHGYKIVGDPGVYGATFEKRAPRGTGSN